MDVPDAAAADAALAEYTDLKERLERINKPSSIRSASQVFPFMLSSAMFTERSTRAKAERRFMLTSMHASNSQCYWSRSIIGSQ